MLLSRYSAPKQATQALTIVGRRVGSRVGKKVGSNVGSKVLFDEEKVSIDNCHKETQRLSTVFRTTHGFNVGAIEGDSVGDNDGDKAVREQRELK